MRQGLTSCDDAVRRAVRGRVLEMGVRKHGAPFLEIEPTSRCNADCLMCPRDAMKRATGNMEWRTFAKIIERLRGSRIRFVNFCGFGEPMINRDVFHFISEMRRELGSSMRLVLTTNGSLLSGDRIDRVLDCGLDALFISFNGVTKASYEKIMFPLKFEETLAKIQDLVERNGERLPLSVVAVHNNLCEEEETRYRTFWSKRGVHSVVYWDAHSRGGNFVDPEFYVRNSPVGNGCDVFQYWDCISWEGEFLPCDMDLSSGRQFGLGNVFEQGFTELHERKRSIMAEDRWFPMCDKCDHPHRRKLVEKYSSAGMLDALQPLPAASNSSQ